MSNDKSGKQSNQLDAAIDELADSSNKIAAVFERFLIIVEDQFAKQPFFKQPFFWTAFIALSGFLGLIFTWQEQLDQIKANNVQKQISIIRNYQSAFNQAATKTRILILNQSLYCPVKSANSRVKFKMERNSSIIAITASLINLTFSGGPEVRHYANQIISSVFNLSTTQLCKININQYDDKLHKIQTKINKTIDSRIKMKETLINQY